MVYAILFGLRVTGHITAGPKAGQSLAGAEMILPDAQSAEEAIAKAESYRGMFNGACEVYSQQWQEHKPGDLGEKQRWCADKRGRGGLLITNGLYVVTM